MLFQTYGFDNPKVHLVIDLGTNDMQNPNMTVEDLETLALLNLTTLICNPDLQKRYADKNAAVEGIVATLAEFDNLAASHRANPNAEGAKAIAQWVEKNIDIAQGMLRIIKWRVLVFEPVAIVENPYGLFVSGSLCQKWSE